MVKGSKVFIDESLKIKRFKEVNERPVVAVALGPIVSNSCAPHPNPGSTVTSCLGGMYRFGRDIPSPGYNKKYRRKFRLFVSKWLDSNVSPLTSSVDLGFDEWIKTAPYPEGRKNELREKWEALNFNGVFTQDQKKKIFKLKSFVKDETYPDWKHARSINSRSDEAKCLFGPIVQAIANAVMKQCPAFIKYVPVVDRPRVIMEKLSALGEKFKASDYTSFEAHFKKQFMIDTDMMLYRYMLRGRPDSAWFIDYVSEAKYKNKNVCQFKNFTIEIEGKRMSGEMDTSLCNGFANLMWLLFSCHIHGIPEESVAAFIEGDDAICRIYGTVPDTFFVDFGLSVKIELHEHLERASFCGMIFDPDDLDNVTDIIKALVNFGWTTAKYFNAKNTTLQAILRCKALSLAYQYKNCPILSAFSLRIMELTRHIDHRVALRSRMFMDTYHLQILDEAINYYNLNGLIPNVKNNTRKLVEDVYGITINDQHKIEAYFSTMLLEPVDCPTLNQYIPAIYRECFDRYTLPRSTRQKDAADLLFCSRKRPVSLHPYVQ